MYAIRSYYDSSILQHQLTLGEKTQWPIEPLLVNDVIHQHVLHIVAGLTKRNALHPGIHGHALLGAPLAHPTGAGIIGGRRQYPVALVLVQQLSYNFV